MTGKKIGYIRVSTCDQNPDRQLEGLTLDKKFIDYASGSNLVRPKLKEMLEYIREDDTVIIHSMDRLARNVKDLLMIVEDMCKMGIEIHFVKENLKFNGQKCPMSKLILMIIGAVAEFEHSIILERQREGIAIAKKAGKYKGKKTKLNAPMKEAMYEQLKKVKTKQEIADELGICRVSLYNYMRKLEIPTKKIPHLHGEKSNENPSLPGQ